MIKNIIRENRQKFLLLIVILIILVAVGVVYAFAVSYQSARNEDAVQKELEAIEEHPGTASIETLEKLLDYSHLSDETLGDIYRDMALSSYLSDDKLEYNSYIGHASYYYDKAGCEEKLASLYSEYLGRLYENSGFKEAENIQKELATKVDIDELKDRAISAAYYLNYADVAQMLDKKELTQKMLKNAKKAVEMSKNDRYRRLKFAKYDMLCTRQALLDGDIKKAQKLLSKYSQKNTLGLDKENLYLKCDFLLPYYELSAKLCLEEGQIEKAYDWTDKYVALCRECNFHMMELRQIRYIIEHTDASDMSAASEVYDVSDASADAGKTAREYQDYVDAEVKLSKSNIEYFSGEYCAALLFNIHEIQNELEAEDAHTSKQKTMIMWIYIALYLLVIGATFLEMIYISFNTDALTGVGNRKLYDRKRRQMERFKKKHHLLIIDIDDFKSVNDNYGHDIGDEVLRDMGQLILANLDKNDHAYRYGGEEFSVVMTDDDSARCLERAEALRIAIEEHTWNHGIRITVSGGMAKSEKGIFPFHEADKALYTAKATGKNKIIVHGRADA